MFGKQMSSMEPSLACLPSSDPRLLVMARPSGFSRSPTRLYQSVYTRSLPIPIATHPPFLSLSQSRAAAALLASLTTAMATTSPSSAMDANTSFVT